VQRRLQVELSETEVTYRDGPLVALGEPPRRLRRTDVGTRARDGKFVWAGKSRQLWPLLGGERHVLLVFEGTGRPIDFAAIAERADERLAVLRVSNASAPDGDLRAAYHQEEAGWVLIRPDQVVAARGGAGDLPLLDLYLDRIIRTNGASCENKGGVNLDLPVRLSALVSG
jgi:hypothetical protein